MSAKDVVLLPQLSTDLQEELQTELTSRSLKHHPFFAELIAQYKFVWNKGVLMKLCNTAVANASAARGDVVFGAGELSNIMIIMLSGAFDYLPFDQSKEM